MINWSKSPNANHKRKAKESPRQKYRTKDKLEATQNKVRTDET